MRLMRNFGFAGYDNVVHPDADGKMPEINAAMGLAFRRVCRLRHQRTTERQQACRAFSGIDWHQGARLQRAYEPDYRLVIRVDERSPDA